MVSYSNCYLAADNDVEIAFNKFHGRRKLVRWRAYSTKPMFRHIPTISFCLNKRAVKYRAAKQCSFDCRLSPRT